MKEKSSVIGKGALWDRLHTFSHVSHRDTGQSWESVSSYMWKCATLPCEAA